MGRQVAVTIARLEKAIGVALLVLGSALLIALLALVLFDDWSYRFAVLWVLSPLALLWLGAGFLRTWPASARGCTAGGVCLHASSAVALSFLLADAAPDPLWFVFPALVGLVGSGAFWVAAKHRRRGRR